MFLLLVEIYYEIRMFIVREFTVLGSQESGNLEDLEKAGRLI